MLINPGLATQLTREHYDQLLVQASRRQLRPRTDRPAPGTRVTRIGRRLAAAITRAGVVVAQSAGTTWPIRPHPLGEPARQTQAPDSSH